MAGPDAKPPRFRTLLLDRVFLVRWTDMITRPDYDTIYREVLAALAKVGPPLFYVSLSGEVRLPTEEEREGMRQNAFKILEKIESMDIVLEGDSMKLSLLRTMFRGMIMAARKSDRIFIVGSLAQTVARVEARLGMPAAELLRRAKSEGMI